MVPDARSRGHTAERNILPAVKRPCDFSGLNRSGSKTSGSSQSVGSRWTAQTPYTTMVSSRDAEPVDLDVLQRGAYRSRRPADTAAALRAVPESCVPTGETSPGDSSRSPIAFGPRRQLAAEYRGCGPRARDAICERGCGGVVAGGHQSTSSWQISSSERAPAGLGIRRRRSELAQGAHPGSGSARQPCQDVVGEPVQRGAGDACAAARRRRESSRRPDRPKGTICHVIQYDPQRFGDYVGAFVEVQVQNTERPSARRREPASFGVEVDLGTVEPTLADRLGGLRHVTGEGRTRCLVKIGCSARLRRAHARWGRSNRLSPNRCRISACRAVLSTEASVRLRMSRPPCGDVTMTTAGISRVKRGQNWLTGPPASRSASSPV